MYRIGKRFRFEAGHSLPRLPDGHKCKRAHGHSYQVEVILTSASLDEYDFVMDYALLDPFKDVLDRNYDHRNLNEVLRRYYSEDEIATTAENLACHFHGILKELIRPFGLLRASLTVRVKETESTFAEYSDG